MGYDKLQNAIVVELVDTPSWGGGGASCEGSSPSNRTNMIVLTLLSDMYSMVIQFGT